MKIVLTPLTEEKTLDCNYFTPTYFFTTEWCLDLHGYLNRDQLDKRLEIINNIVKENPLLSDRAKKGLLYAFAAIFIFLLLIAVFGAKALGLAIPITMEFINTAAFFIGKKLVEKAAKQRSDKFSAAINDQFKIFNNDDNPIANWRLVWRNVLTHYKIETKFDPKSGKTKGKSKPKYAEHAEIVLEISDSLSGITQNDVRIKLGHLGLYKPSNIDDIYPDGSDAGSLVQKSSSSQDSFDNRTLTSNTQRPFDEKRMPLQPNSPNPKMPNYSQDERTSFENRTPTPNSQRTPPQPNFQNPSDNRTPPPNFQRMPLGPSDKRILPPNIHAPYDERTSSERRTRYNQTSPNYYTV
ncbi:hypothetical protein C1645_832489 [Glomus cerebriforme]|uniref:Uncharacterized protein n=1 Tax=Glomus cerebriforme TaxID=658196 RepID=A0A397SDF1_9GLOM|nr:hypothetical protein C1645_832489 [Glomus cerebriforme]